MAMEETQVSDKKEYELAFLTRAEDSVEEVIAMLKKSGAEITSQGTLVRQRLAYPIEKETQAVMGSLNFRLDPDAIAGLDHELRFNPHVLRFLMVTPPIAKPQGMMYERRAAQQGEPRRSAETQERRRAAPASVSDSASSSAHAPKATARTQKAEPAPAAALSNEALEKRLEEILK